jgi:hypothetical protein
MGDLHGAPQPLSRASRSFRSRHSQIQYVSVIRNRRGEGEGWEGVERKIAVPVGRELRLGVEEWGEVLAAIGGRTGIESVIHPPRPRFSPAVPSHPPFSHLPLTLIIHRTNSIPLPTLSLPSQPSSHLHPNVAAAIPFHHTPPPHLLDNPTLTPPVAFCDAPPRRNHFSSTPLAIPRYHSMVPFWSNSARHQSPRPPPLPPLFFQNAYAPQSATRSLHSQISSEFIDRALF